jgi:hypothetical protein
MKAVTRLLCSLGLILALTAESRGAAGIVKTIGGSYTPGYLDGNNLVSLFNQPSGLAVDIFGRLLVADFGNNAVRFITLADDVTGTFTKSNINGPIAVGVTTGGDVLVVNYNAGNVARFDRNGAFLSLFATNLANPTAIALDTSGNVYIAAQAGGIRRYSPTGSFVQSYSLSQGTPNFRGITVAPDGTLAVTDSGNEVVWKFPIVGGSAFIFAGTLSDAGFADGGVGFGKLNSPQQIATGPGGALIIADRLNHRIRAADANGVLSTLYGADPAIWEGAPPETLPGWADGSADQAELHDPVGVTANASGTVFDSEVFYGVIRQASGLSFPTNTTGGNSGPSGATRNEISLGFAGGEASSDFVGAPGQRFSTPITLTLVPGTTIYGLQFNASVAPANASAPDANYLPAFRSLLAMPDAIDPHAYNAIEPKLFIRYDPIISQQIVAVNGINTLVTVTNFVPVFSPLVITSEAGNLLGVGWLERYTRTNLYNTLLQDLIRYSAAHDYLYDGTKGKVVVGAATFRIPPNAPMTAEYQFSVGRPSAVGDGIAQDVVLETPDGTDPTNPIAATRTLKMGIRQYLVGDVVPFRWFNAGDFGDGSILANDLEEVHQLFAYGYNSPPEGSDMFDALDSCCVSADGSFNYSDPTDFQFADAATLNDIGRGDGAITLEDLYVTFRRSLDPSLVNYVRYWSNGVLNVAVTTNSFRGKAADASAYKYKKPALNLARLDEPATAKFSAGNAKASPGQTVHIPVTIDVTGPLTVSSVMVKLAVVGLDNTPALTTSISFTSSTDIGTPTASKVGTASTFSGIWFEVQNPLGAGSHQLGTVDFVIPATANADTLYTIQIDQAQASSGLTRFPVTTSNGFVLSADRALAPWTDEIPDSWRIQYFGSLMNILSAPDADADGDGMTNLQEYRAGTNPNDVTSRFAVNGSNSATGVTLKWPTVTGKTYRLESASALTGATWTVIEDSITGTGGIIERTQPSNNGQTRFYRVHTN